MTGPTSEESMRIAILGTGGNCIDILDTIMALGMVAGYPRIECVGFFDDNPDNWGTEYFGRPVLGPLSAARSYNDCSFVNGIGSPNTYRLKAEIIDRTCPDPNRFVSLVHPTAYVSPLARIGRGVVVLPNSTVASRVVIGDHVMILPQSVVNHDCTVGSYSIVCSGVCLSGSVTVEEACYLGSNCSVRQGLRIGSGSLIGMGSVVIRNVQPGSVVAGNPARLLRQASQV